jgi:hypothetical protein
MQIKTAIEHDIKKAVNIKLADGNIFTQALAKILSGRMPASNINTLRTPTGDIINESSSDESIGAMLPNLNPVNALRKALGE